jgi:cell division protein FtsL
MMRLLNIGVIAALVLAAADVYKIKFESARQAERLAKLRMEITREHDAIAALRAEWSKLDTPARIEALARRHLALKPIEAAQFDTFDNLPARPAERAAPEDADSSAMIANSAPADPPATGSIPPVRR